MHESPKHSNPPRQAKASQEAVRADPPAPSGRPRRRKSARRPDASERRAQIAAALDASIRERGYAATTLTDIASAAGMSPSHIHYYFDGKAAVLEHHFGELCAGLLADVLPLADKPPLERIDATVAYFFENPKFSRQSSGVYFEIFGVAVHNDGVRAIKKGLDRALRDFFVELFADTDLSPRAAENAADIALGLLVGLSTNAYFDEDRSRSQAGEVFRSELLRLAGAGLLTPLPSEDTP